MKEKLPKILYISALVIIFIIAVTARLKAYLAVRSIWIDEALIIDSIASNDIINPFSIYKNYQIMPPFFFMTERFIYKIFGMHELVLRFFPFISSIIAIPLFYIFSKMFLEKKWSIIAANFLFAINIFLIFYAQELKQYSSDVMWFLLIFILLNRINIKDISRKNACIHNVFIYITATALIPLFSTPAYFVIGAWVIRELLSCRKVKEFLYLIALQLPAGIITGIYFNSILKLYDNFIKYYPHLWNNGFITNNFKFNLYILENNIQYFFKPNTNSILEIILISAGLIILAKNFKLKENLLLIFTICFMLLFSYLKIYPLAQRISLYSIPFIILFAVKALDYISLKNKILSLIITILFVFSFNRYGINYITKCYTSYALTIRWSNIYMNSKALMQTLIIQYKPTDTIICNNDSMHEYNYYKKYYNFEPKREYVIKNYSTQNIQEAGITPLKGNYWLIFLCDYTKGNGYLNFIKYSKNFKIIYKKDIGTGHLLYVEKE